MVPGPVPRWRTDIVSVKALMTKKSATPVPPSMTKGFAHDGIGRFGCATKGRWNKTTYRAASPRRASIPGTWFFGVAAETWVCEISELASFFTKTHFNILLLESRPLTVDSGKNEHT